MLHREIYYLSERLATDLVQQANRKSKPRMHPSLTLPIPGIPVSASLTQQSVDSAAVNRYALADEAMKAAADEAGTWRFPGRYVFLDRTPFKLWVFSFKSDDDKRPIAISLFEPSFSAALAIMVGSAGNVFGYHSERKIDGWIPSDPIGLRELGRFGRDADLDPAMSKVLTPDLAAHQFAEFSGENPPDLIYDAAYIAAQISRTPDYEGYADVLARVHEYRDDVIVELPALGHKRMFSRIIVGAAIFICEPTPRPFEARRTKQ
jgi:hypothetical protein